MTSGRWGEKYLFSSDNGFIEKYPSICSSWDIFEFESFGEVLSPFLLSLLLFFLIQVLSNNLLIDLCIMTLGVPLMRYGREMTGSLLPPLSRGLYILIRR